MHPLPWLILIQRFFLSRKKQKEIYLSMNPGSCSFRIRMGIGFYLKNPRNGCLLFPAPSVERRPFVLKYTSPNTLSHVVSEYIWLWGLSTKPYEWLLAFSWTFRREMPLEMKYTYLNTLGHIVSEYTWLWEPINKTLGEVACFFLLVQEGNILWKWNILIQVPWVM